MKKEALIQEIKKAFAGVPVPSKITFHVAEAHDDYDYQNDDKHRQKDHLGSWEEIPEEHFLNCEYAIPYLDAEGIQYYLPALMIWTLTHYQQGNEAELNMDSTIYALNPQLENEKLKAYHENRFSMFNLYQNKACAKFLKYFMENDPKGVWIDIVMVKKAYAEKWYRHDES